MIAQFAAVIQPEIRPFATAKTLEIKGLLLRRRQLMEMRTMELNRLQQLGGSLGASCKRIIKLLEKAVVAVDVALD